MMKYAALLLPVLAALAPGLDAQDPDAPRRGGGIRRAPTDRAQPADAAQDAASAEEFMKGVNRNFRVISRFLRKPEGDAPMAAVMELQKMALQAKIATPSLAETKPEDERAAFVAAYRKDMNKFLRQILDLEDAMAAQEWEKATEIAKALNEAKKAGHEAYKGKDKDGDGDGDDAPARRRPV